jgi:hypothetical protein
MIDVDGGDIRYSVGGGIGRLIVLRISAENRRLN